MGKEIGRDSRGRTGDAYALGRVLGVPGHIELSEPGGRLPVIPLLRRMPVEDHSTRRFSGGSTDLRGQSGTIFGVNGLASGLGVLVVFGSGITAGLLFCVAFTIVPAFAGMTAENYVRLHKQLGRNVDRLMPFVVMGSMVGDIVLAVVAPRGWWLFAFSAVALLGVSTVSHLCNLPINKNVRSLAEKPIPHDWKDPRQQWRGWNLLRTGFSFVALALNGVALVVST